MKMELNITHKIDRPSVLKRLVKILAMAMAEMEYHAVRMCPVLTGFLRGTIHLEKLNDFFIRLVDGAVYGVHQEFGTVKMRAQPFFRPAKVIIERSTLPRLFRLFFGK